MIRHIDINPYIDEKGNHVLCEIPFKCKIIGFVVDADGEDKLKVEVIEE